MGAYAAGKYALAACDRCGFQYFLNELKKEWTGFKVCDECYEPKHPQLEPKRHINDVIALKEPRPEQPGHLEVFVGIPGDSTFGSIGMMPDPVAQYVIGYSGLGRVTVETT
jgi:hypothetical protein